MTSSPRSSQARISAVVVSHGHEQQVPSVVEDLRLHEAGVVQRVVVVDNLSAGFLRERYRDDEMVRVLEPPQRGGFGRNANLAVSSLEDDWDLVCLINPDVRLEGPVVSALDQVRRRTGWGIVAPLLVDAESRQPDANARQYPSVLRLGARTMRRLLGLSVSERALPDLSAREEAEVDWLSGAFMLLETAWFRALGGFDEAFFMYGEDVDLCLRSRARGRPVGVTRRVEALHVGARQSAQDHRHLRWHLSSLARLYRKYGVSGPRRGEIGSTG